MEYSSMWIPMDLHNEEGESKSLPNTPQMILEAIEKQEQFLREEARKIRHVDEDYILADSAVKWDKFIESIEPWCDKWMFGALPELEIFCHPRYLKGIFIRKKK